MAPIVTCNSCLWLISSVTGIVRKVPYYNLFQVYILTLSVSYKNIYKTHYFLILPITEAPLHIIL